jgi:hypothetical protein
MFLLLIDGFFIFYDYRIRKASRTRFYAINQPDKKARWKKLCFYTYNNDLY